MIPKRLNRLLQPILTLSIASAGCSTIDTAGFTPIPCAKNNVPDYLSGLRLADPADYIELRHLDSLSGEPAVDRSASRTVARSARARSAPTSRAWPTSRPLLSTRSRRSRVSARITARPRGSCDKRSARCETRCATPHSPGALRRATAGWPRGRASSDTRPARSKPSRPRTPSRVAFERRSARWSERGRPLSHRIPLSGASCARSRAMRRGMPRSRGPSMGGLDRSSIGPHGGASSERVATRSRRSLTIRSRGPTPSSCDGPVVLMHPPTLRWRTRSAAPSLHRRAWPRAWPRA
jgi:hypothetical protein